MSEPEVTVVLASIDARATIAGSLAAFSREAEGRGEVVVVDSWRDGSADLAEGRDGVRVIRLPRGRLAPELWSVGIERSKSRFVALSTAQMVPRTGWLAALMTSLKATGAAGVGGPIAPGEGLGPIDRAMYLLRYANYWPPLRQDSIVEPPGDNALYLRESIEAVRESYALGFWEVEVHRALRSKGHPLALAPDAIVEFRGGSRLGPSITSRSRHARHYGAGRSGRRSFPERLARTAAGPAVPAVLLSRIVGQIRRRGEPIGPWLPALPHLSVLLSAWSLGEVAGGWLGPPRSRGEAA